MDTTRLPKDFKDFLRLLNAHGVEYLLIGGYAVIYHGYPRTTGDMDIWIAQNVANAERMAATLSAFGFGTSEVDAATFLEPNKILRMGIPPYRIEILTTISGVEFDECWETRLNTNIEDIPVSVISLDKLLVNKIASGRYKDLNDVQELS